MSEILDKYLVILEDAKISDYRVSYEILVINLDRIMAQ